MFFSVPLDQYTTISTRTAAPTLSLARALLVAAPQPPAPIPGPVADRLARIELRAKRLQQAWIDASRPNTTEVTLRELDVGDDRCWSVTRSRLEDWIALADPERGPRAAELLALLFPSGLDFLHLPYAEQWAEGARRLALIDGEPGLAAELADLIDARVLARLRQSHAAYGDAQAITRERAAQVDEASVHDHVQALRIELASYARLILGLTHHDDEVAVAAAKAQLEPILRFRAASRRPSGDTSGGAEASDPVEPIADPVPPAPLAD
jgi:hypothetical protein